MFLLTQTLEKSPVALVVEVRSAGPDLSIDFKRGNPRSFREIAGPILVEWLSPVGTNAWKCMRYGCRTCSWEFCRPQSARTYRSMDRIYQSRERWCICVRVCSRRKYDRYTRFRGCQCMRERVSTSVRIYIQLAICLTFSRVSAGSAQSVLLKFFPRLLKLHHFLSPAESLLCTSYVTERFRAGFDYF